MSQAYARDATSVFRLACYLVGNRAEAEDVLQETFVRVFSAVRPPKSEPAIRAYLHRTAINLIRSQWRRNLRARTAAADAHTFAPTDNPIEETEHIWRLLRALPTRQKAVLYLKHYEGRSEREIAELLDCSIGAVRSLAHRGQTALRKEMRTDGTRS